MLSNKMLRKWIGVRSGVSGVVWSKTEGQKDRGGDNKFKKEKV